MDEDLGKNMFGAGGTAESRVSHTLPARKVDVVQNPLDQEKLTEHEEELRQEVVDRFKLPHNLRGAEFDIRGIGTLQVYGGRQELPNITAQYTNIKDEVWEIEVGDRKDGAPGHIVVNRITTDKNRRKIVTPLVGSYEALSHAILAFNDLLADHENPTAGENRGEAYIGGTD